MDDIVRPYVPEFRREYMRDSECKLPHTAIDMHYICTGNVHVHAHTHTHSLNSCSSFIQVCRLHVLILIHSCSYVLPIS